MDIVDEVFVGIGVGYSYVPLDAVVKHDRLAPGSPLVNYPLSASRWKIVSSPPPHWRNVWMAVQSTR